MTYYNHKTAVIIDQSPKRTVFYNRVIKYRVTYFKNILRSFETYYN